MLPIGPIFSVFGLACGHGLLPDCHEMDCASVFRMYSCYQESQFYHTPEYEKALRLGHDPYPRRRSAHQLRQKAPEK